jgi:glucose/arabinose dehydrogenase
MLKSVLPLMFLAAALSPGLLGQATQPKPGIGVVHLGPGPYTFDTAEQHQVKVTVVAKGLAHPFSIAFLPNGDALVVERGVGLRIIHDVTGPHPNVDPEMVAGVPTFPRTGTSGIQDVLLHPKFASNRLVYFTYNKVQPAQGQQRPKLAGAVGRGKFDGKALTDVQEIFAGEWGDRASGLRMVFGPDGMLYFTSGAPFSQASGDLGSVYGKVLRVRDDGTIPPDNPFVGKAGARPEIFAFGFRDQLGIVYHEASGNILATDHGPNGGDEINVIRPGLDYGWPKYSFGRQYEGPRVSELPVVQGIEQPILLWIPSVAPSGLEIYTGNRFPAWKGNLFVGSAQRGEIQRTGGLERVVLNPKLQELRRESLLTDLHLRVRFVRQGPDELLYVLTEQTNGGPDEDSAVLRLEPTP